MRGRWLPRRAEAQESTDDGESAESGESGEFGELGVSGEAGESWAGAVVLGGVSTEAGESTEARDATETGESADSGVSSDGVGLFTESPGENEGAGTTSKPRVVVVKKVSSVVRWSSMSIGAGVSELGLVLAMA